MAGDRYVLLGLARPRSAWFSQVSQWATSAAIPAEFLKCVSVEELRARLASGRPFSAVLLDGGLPSVDRDVLEAARSAGCVVVVVDDGRGGRDWRALGVAAVLPPTLDRPELLDVLATHAELVGRVSLAALDDEGSQDVDAGSVVAVCGPGGTGASTVAAALAQGLGRSRGVVLADLTRNAEQAMLHDVGDVIPGVQELVELHRSRRPGDDEVRATTFDVLERQYHLLLGIRRARYWAALRPRSFDAAFASLRRVFDLVVCDVTADLEGEEEGGSADVEERNHPARTAVRAADVVFAVGRPGIKGVHSLVRVLADLATVGVPAGRIVPVVNLAPRQPRARAELARTIADLGAPVLGGGHTAPPVFLPARKVEEALRDVVPLPAPLPARLAGAYEATVGRLGTSVSVAAEPELVAPGSFGGAFGADA